MKTEDRRPKSEVRSPKSEVGQIKLLPELMKKDKLRKIVSMETKHFPLGSTESNKFVNLIRILFGITCIAVSLYWLSFNLKSLKNDGSLWITIVFLTLFGLYLIWAGLGKAYRFIEIGKNRIRLKKNPFQSAVQMESYNIERIELYPLNVIFYLKSGKRNLLRFGTTYYETNEKIKDEIVKFAGLNSMQLDVIDEKL
jgi:hypothetical protein